MLQNLDMQHTDSGSSYDQYYQSHFQNPNPSSNPTDPPPQFNPFPSTFASAPPVPSIYSSAEYPVYSSSSSSNYSTNPPYPQYTDHAPNPPLTYPSNPNYQSSDPSPQPYNFPHLSPQMTPCYGFDQNQAGPNYDHSNPSYNSNANSSFSLNSYSTASNYENLYSSNYGRYGEQGIYEDMGKQRPEIGSGYDHGEYRDSVGGDGVYAYSGGKMEPYGARGSGPGSSGVIFDDYGRPIGFENGKRQDASGSAGKVVKAIPKSETQQDVGSGVQKYRAKLLSEGAGQTDMDVLCQVCE